MEEQLSFQFALPSGWHVINADPTGIVPRLDTNGDGELEWVILYSFDVPGNQTFTPIRCAIYHAVRREPRWPIIYPYHLQAPGWTYLGEGAGRVSVHVDDVLTDIEPDDEYPEGTYFAPDEVIVEAKSPAGQTTRVSIFQWRNTVVPPEYRSRIDPQEHIVLPSEPPGFNSQWYQCVGLFEGTVDVQVQPNRVTVRDRINDRSQLALVKTYEPSAASGGYLYGGRDLVEPISSCIDFAFGLPEDVAQSPYPEKIVMAFHRQYIEQPVEYGSAFLTEHAKTRRANDPEWNLFTPSRAPVIERVCVKSLRYGSELEAEVESFETSVDRQDAGEEPPPIVTRVETWAEYAAPGYDTERTRVIWELIRVDNHWQINDILDIGN
jgi:hypothetical protein